MKFLSGFSFWTKLGEADLILNGFVCFFAPHKLGKLNWTVFRVPGRNCIHPLEQIWMTYSDCDAWDTLPSCVAVACGLEITQLTADAPISSVSRHSKKDGNQSETIQFFFSPPDVDPSERRWEISASPCKQTSAWPLTPVGLRRVLLSPVISASPRASRSLSSASVSPSE